MNSVRTRFYRDKANGKWMGVCAGIADYTGLDVLWVRLGFVIATVCGMGFMPVVYFALGFLSENKPKALYADAEEAKFWQGVRTNTKRSAQEIRSTFRDIDRRLADIESYYVSKNTQLSDEIERLR